MKRLIISLLIIAFIVCGVVFGITYFNKNDRTNTGKLQAEYNEYYQSNDTVRLKDLTQNIHTKYLQKTGADLTEKRLQIAYDTTDELDILNEYFSRYVIKIEKINNAATLRDSLNKLKSQRETLIDLYNLAAADLQDNALSVVEDGYNRLFRETSAYLDKYSLWLKNISTEIKNNYYRTLTIKPVKLAAYDLFLESVNVTYHNLDTNDFLNANALNSLELISSVCFTAEYKLTYNDDLVGGQYSSYALNFSKYYFSLDDKTNIAKNLENIIPTINESSLNTDDTEEMAVYYFLKTFKWGTP